MKYLEYVAKGVFSRARKADFVKYPLFSTPADLKLHANQPPQRGVLRLLSKLRDGTYLRHKNDCLCGNHDPGLDQVISHLEIHAIPLDILLCGKCGLIRSAEVLDAQSNADYYRYEYREIFNGGKAGIPEYFNSQMERGSRFVQILKSTKIFDQIRSIAEIGCGCGGNLYPFHLGGKVVAGYDYDDDYLNYGRSKGMEMLRIGEHTGPIPRGSPDLLILSHVVEHFLNPRQELTEHIANVEPGKFLLIEVPGVFCPSTKLKLHGYPVRYFQFAHVFQFFYRRYLEVFYKSFGLEIIYGDETATFVLRKPFEWKPVIPESIYSEELRGYPEAIDAYLKDSFFDYAYGPNRQNVAWSVSTVLERAGVRNVVRRLLRRQ